MIEISAAVLEQSKVQTLVEDLASYDMILLTSRFSVKYFFTLFQNYDYDTACLKIMPFIVIGYDTAQALKSYGFVPELISKEETSQGLFAAMVNQFDVKGKKILFPRSALPNPYLREELSKQGAQVDELIVYENIKPAKKPLPPVGDIDTIFFTSPSTVRNFLEDYTTIPKAWEILSKGKVTQKYLEQSGYQNEIVIKGMMNHARTERGHHG